MQFVNETIGRSSDSDTIAALRKVAEQKGITPTELDARIWDFMQSRSGGTKAESSCKSDVSEDYETDA